MTDAGEFLGIMPTKDALDLARQKGLDLVEVSANADPPVAKIMDFGKYKYLQKKNSKKNNSNKGSLKEIQMGVNIEDHDIGYKRKRMLEFLKDGHRVKVTVAYHGREMSHKEIGEAVLQRMLEGIDTFGKIESGPKMEGKHLSAIIVAS